VPTTCCLWCVLQVGQAFKKDAKAVQEALEGLGEADALCMKVGAAVCRGGWVWWGAWLVSLHMWPRCCCVAPTLALVAAWGGLHNVTTSRVHCPPVGKCHLHCLLFAVASTGHHSASILKG
jgi:hypothetical protein